MEKLNIEKLRVPSCKLQSPVAQLPLGINNRVYTVWASGGNFVF